MERQAKKAAVRQRISNIATTLFFAEGFDAVTVQQIAEAAGVSKMTVHNYFPRKEDLFFDRRGEATKHLAEAIAARKKGVSIVRAMHGLVRRLRKEEHPFASVNPGRGKFWEVVEASPALSARGRELADEEVADLANVLARAVKRKAPDATARLVAGTTLTIWRTAYAESLRVLRAEAHSKAKVHAAFDAVLDRGFAMLQAGMKGTPYG